MEQFDKIRGTRTFQDTMYHQYAESCGRDYSTATLTVTSGSPTISDTAAFNGNEVNNYLVIDSGDAAGVYLITAVSGTNATVSPTPSASATSVSGRRHYVENLEDDLNYIRKMMNLVIGENNWNDTPDTDLRNMAFLIPKRPNYVGETTQYTDRPGTVTYTISDIDQTGKVSSGAPAGEYTDTTASVNAGDTVRFTDDNTMALSITGGFYPADVGTLQIVQDGTVVGTLDLAAAWTADGCAYEEDETDVGTNPNHTASNTGTDIINLTNRRCMNTTVDSYSSFWPPYQMASMSATLTLAAGYVGQISVQHSIGGSSTYTYSSFWVDTTDQAIAAPAPTVTSGTAYHKYLSGVPYYNTNSTFGINVTDSEDLFDRGYVTSPLRLNLSQFNASNQTPSLTTLGLTEPLAITDTIGSYDSVVTVGAGNFRDLDARATATYWNVFASATSSDSAAGTFRIDTYGTTSTNTVEYFDDEDKRYVGTEDFTDITLGDTPSTDSAWVEATDRSAGGHLVVYNGTLKYPTIDHSAFLPVGPDYSSVSGDCYYYRVFITTGAFNQGTITFSGWSNALSTIQGSDVEVHLRLPNCSDYGNGNTAVWQDLSVDQQTYGGDGCLGAGSSGSSVAFSFGTTSSSSYGNRIVMRIKFANSNPTALTQITFNPTL